MLKISLVVCLLHVLFISSLWGSSSQLPLTKTEFDSKKVSLKQGYKGSDFKVVRLLQGGFQLDDLPSELLVPVFASLSRIGQANTRRVSRYFRAIIDELIWPQQTFVLRERPFGFAHKSALGNTVISPSILQTLKNLPFTAFQLSLARTPWDDETLHALASFRGVTSLSFNFLGYESEYSYMPRYHIIRSIASLSSLTCLSLYSAGLKDYHIGHLACLTALTALSLPHNKITHLSVPVIATFTQLNYLDIHNNDIAVRDKVFAILDLVTLGTLQSLETLNVSNNNLGLNGLATLRCLTRLKALVINEIGMDGEGLNELAHYSHLRHLEIGNNMLTDSNVEDLVKLTSLTCLSLKNYGLLYTSNAFKKDARITLLRRFIGKQIWF